MSQFYESEINGAKIKITVYRDEKTLWEPSTGSSPTETRETYYVTKNGKFWGQRTSYEYAGNFEGQKWEKKEDTYKLTIGDEKNFDAVIYKIMSKCCL